jgi:beta-glucanase (GH16 family)
VTLELHYVDTDLSLRSFPRGTTVGPPGFVEGWGHPTWRDEFESETIDTDKWTIRDQSVHGNLSYDWGVIQASNAFIDDGKLVLRISRRESSVTSGGRVRWWDTAYLDTMGGKLEERYGRWEMRAKLPTVADYSRGVWPAFWLRNGELGEIDIMESWGDPPDRARASNLTETSTFTIHEKTTGGGAKFGRTYEHHVDTPGPPYSTASNFHTFAIEYTPTYLKALFDGMVAAHITADGAGGTLEYPWVWGSEFDSDWNIRLNTQMGDPYWTPDPDHEDENIVTPADFVIDHVRYWALPD